MFNHDDSFGQGSRCEQDSSVRGYFPGGKSMYLMNNNNYDEFSFKLNYSQQMAEKSQTQYQSANNTLTLRQNLGHLEKQEIIELLLQQIKSSNQHKQKYTTLISERQMCEQTFGVNHHHSKDSKDFVKYKTQYEQLVKDFQEYISNTQQAQTHFVRGIQELKRQNKELHEKDKKLQEAISKYLEINNQLLSKVEKLQRFKVQNSQQINKLKRAVEKLEFQCDTLDKENQNLLNQNQNFRAIIEQLKQYIKEKRQIKNTQNYHEDSFYVTSELQHHKKSQKSEDSIMNNSQIKRRQNNSINESGLLFPNPLQQNKSFHDSFNFCSEQQFSPNTFHIMQIQNKELKLTNMKLEGLLEKKSQKIRKLLDQIELMSEQRLKMKQEIIESKTLGKQQQQNKQLKQSKDNCQVPNIIGGVKMISSSIYSLKNSQSTCLQTSKGQKIDENIITPLQSQRSAIRQAYTNCFKKQSSQLKSTQESGSKYKVENIRPQECYVPKALFSSNKKNSDRQEIITGSQINNESFGVIKKRQNVYKLYEQNQDYLAQSKLSIDRNAKVTQNQLKGKENS